MLIVWLKTRTSLHFSQIYFYYNAFVKKVSALQDVPVGI